MGRTKISASELQFNQAVGERIRSYRNMRKIPLEEAARSVDVTINQFLIYERGMGSIRAAKLNDIAKVFQVPVVELLPEDNGTDQFDMKFIELLTAIESAKDLTVQQVIEIVKGGYFEGIKAAIDKGISGKQVAEIIKTFLDCNK